MQNIDNSYIDLFAVDSFPYWTPFHHAAFITFWDINNLFYYFHTPNEKLKISEFCFQEEKFFMNNLFYLFAKCKISSAEIAGCWGLISLKIPYRNGESCYKYYLGLRSRLGEGKEFKKNLKSFIEKYETNDFSNYQWDRFEKWFIELSPGVKKTEREQQINLINRMEFFLTTKIDIEKVFQHFHDRKLELEATEEFKAIKRDKKDIITNKEEFREYLRVKIEQGERVNNLEIKTRKLKKFTDDSETIENPAKTNNLKLTKANISDTITIVKDDIENEAILKGRSGKRNYVELKKTSIKKPRIPYFGFNEILTSDYDSEPDLYFLLEKYLPTKKLRNFESDEEKYLFSDISEESAKVWKRQKNDNKTEKISVKRKRITPKAQEAQGYKRVRKSGKPYKNNKIRVCNYLQKKYHENGIESKKDSQQLEQNRASKIRDKSKFFVLPYKNRLQYKEEWFDDDSIIMPKKSRIKKLIKFEEEEEEEQIEQKEEKKTSKFQTSISTFISIKPRFQMNEIKIPFEQIQEVQDFLFYKKNEINSITFDLTFNQRHEFLENNNVTANFKLKEMMRKIKHAFSLVDHYNYLVSLKLLSAYLAIKSNVLSISNDYLQKINLFIKDLFMCNLEKPAGLENEEQNMEIQNVLISIADCLDFSQDWFFKILTFILHKIFLAIFFFKVDRKNMIHSNMLLLSAILKIFKKIDQANSNSQSFGFLIKELINFSSKIFLCCEIIANKIAIDEKIKKQIILLLRENPSFPELPDEAYYIRIFGFVLKNLGTPIENFYLSKNNNESTSNEDIKKMLYEVGKNKLDIYGWIISLVSIYENVFPHIFSKNDLAILFEKLIIEEENRINGQKEYSKNMDIIKIMISICKFDYTYFFKIKEKVFNFYLSNSAGFLEDNSVLLFDLNFKIRAIQLEHLFENLIMWENHLSVLFLQIYQIEKAAPTYSEKQEKRIFSKALTSLRQFTRIQSNVSKNGEYRIFLSEYVFILVLLRVFPQQDSILSIFKKTQNIIVNTENNPPFIKMILLNLSFEMIVAFVRAEERNAKMVNGCLTIIESFTQKAKCLIECYIDRVIMLINEISELGKFLEIGTNKTVGENEKKLESLFYDLSQSLEKSLAGIIELIDSFPLMIISICEVITSKMAIFELINPNKTLIKNNLKLKFLILLQKIFILFDKKEKIISSIQCPVLADKYDDEDDYFNAVLIQEMEAKKCLELVECKIKGFNDKRRDLLIKMVDLILSSYNKLLQERTSTKFKLNPEILELSFNILGFIAKNLLFSDTKFTFERISSIFDFTSIFFMDSTQSPFTWSEKIRLSSKFISEVISYQKKEKFGEIIKLQNSSNFLIFFYTLCFQLIFEDPKQMDGLWEILLIFKKVERKNLINSNLYQPLNQMSLKDWIFLFDFMLDEFDLFFDMAGLLKSFFKKYKDPLIAEENKKIAVRCLDEALTLLLRRIKSNYSNCTEKEGIIHIALSTIIVLKRIAEFKNFGRINRIYNDYLSFLNSESPFGRNLEKNNLDCSNSFLLSFLIQHGDYLIFVRKVVRLGVKIAESFFLDTFFKLILRANMIEKEDYFFSKCLNYEENAITIFLKEISNFKGEKHLIYIYKTAASSVRNFSLIMNFNLGLVVWKNLEILQKYEPFMMKIHLEGAIDILSNVLEAIILENLYKDNKNGFQNNKIFFKIVKRVLKWIEESQELLINDLILCMLAFLENLTKIVKKIALLLMQDMNYKNGLTTEKIVILLKKTMKRMRTIEKYVPIMENPSIEDISGYISFFER